MIENRSYFNLVTLNMIRFLFAFTVLVHGLLHTLGFIKAFKLTSVNQLITDISKPAGMVWQIASLLFLLTTALILLHKDWWWIIASVAIILSQILIILYWRDAKFGTIANLIILIGIALSYGTWSFKRNTKKELKTLQTSSNLKKEIVTEQMLKELPPVVQKWLVRSKIIGKERTYTVHLKQTGQMRTEETGKWMPVKAEQFFSTDPPGFIWIADVRAAPFIHLSGMDKYQNGRGYMQIKLLSLFPLVNAKGEKTDQGTLLRYLAEIVWFPSAALNKYISWQGLNSNQAKATMSYGNITASGIFSFISDGDILSFEAQRYYSRKGGATLENWFIAVDKNGYKDFESIRVPAKSAVSWKLKTGDFTWYKVEVTDIKFNEF